MVEKFDIHFNVYSDTPPGKDPDAYSPTLRKYHKILWSKNLPNGQTFHLNDHLSGVLHHKSILGEFLLSSDSIGHTYFDKSCVVTPFSDITRTMPFF